MKRSLAAKRLGFEQLESRRVLAAASATFLNSILTVQGDGSHNSITIYTDPSGNFLVPLESATVYVSDPDNGLANYETCTQIRILGGEGEDTYSHQLDFSIPVIYDGGPGVQDRFIIGGDGNFTLGASSVSGANFTFSNAEVATINGGDGPNRIRNAGFTGYTFLVGGGGNDTLIGGPGINRIYGDGGNDSLQGGPLDDELYGGEGSDTLKGGTGDDRLWGGEGSDNLDGQAGIDTIRGEGGGDRITDLLEQSLIYGGLGNDTITCGPGNDLIFGEEGSDNITAGDGNNTIDGSDGNDILRGGKNSNFFYPGKGNDQLFGGEGTDSLFETRDTNFTLTKTSLKIGGETDTLSNIENADLTGGDGANIFNITDGLSGVTIYGKAGADRLIYNATNTQVSIAGGVGTSDLSLTTFNPDVSSVMTFSDPIESVFLKLGSSDDSVDIRDFTGKIQIDGGGGENDIAYTKNANLTLTDTAIRDTAGTVISYTNFDLVKLSSQSSAGLRGATGATGDKKTINAKEFTGNLAILDEFKLLQLETSSAQNPVNIDMTTKRITRADGKHVEFQDATLDAVQLRGKASGADFRVSFDPGQWTQTPPLLQLFGKSNGTDKLSATLSGSAGAARINLGDQGGGSGTISAGPLASSAATRFISYVDFSDVSLVGNDSDGEMRVFGPVDGGPVTPTLKATLDGRGGKDRFVYKGAVPTDAQLSDTAFSSAAGSLNIGLASSSFEDATLYIAGAAGEANLDVSGWHKRANLIANADADVGIVIVGDANYTLTDTLLTRSSGGSFSLTNINKVRIEGGNSANTMNATGYSHKAIIYGGGGGDTIRGGSGSDEIYGEAGNDKLFGNGSADIIHGGTNTDSADGGAGFDFGISIENPTNIEDLQAAIFATDEFLPQRKRRT